MTTISTGYTQDPDIFTRCRNLCDTLREVYGNRFAGKMVGDLVASFDGEITPEFERKLTAMSRDALAIDAEGQRPEPLVTARLGCHPSCPLVAEPGDNLTARENAGFGTGGPL